MSSEFFQHPGKETSWIIFNEIAPRYDLINRLLSFGQDLAWRGQIANYIPKSPNLALLDLATGTADVLISLLKKCPQIKTAQGIDLADNMLKLGQKKIKKLGLEKKAALKLGDITSIPFPDQCFNITTIAFGIRNVSNPQPALKEMYRVLKPQGRSLILEFSLPTTPGIKQMHLFYLNNIIPIWGGLLSGKIKAYQYLKETIQTFPSKDDFCSLMQKAGFKGAQAHPLLFGTATIYFGDKK